MLFMSDRGDQPGPPSPKGGRNEQVPTALTSYRTKDENDTSVGDVSIMSCGGVNPIGGDRRDNVVIPFDERRPRTVCQHSDILICTEAREYKAHHKPKPDLYTIHVILCQESNYFTHHHERPMPPAPASSPMSSVSQTRYCGWLLQSAPKTKSEFYVSSSKRGIIS